MSDYIKREAAIKALDDIKNINEDSWLGARYALKHNISSTDVVEVVRCKDCKHGEDAVRGNYKHKLNLIDCNRINFEHPYIMSPNDFCSYGERAKRLL